MELDNSFSWRNVAASAVGAAVAGYVGGNGSELVSSAVRGQIRAYASAVLKDKWFGGARPDFGQVVADAFGNTLSDYMLHQIQRGTGSIEKLTVSLADHQSHNVLNSGQYPDTLTSDDLKYLSRSIRANGVGLESGLYESVFVEKKGICPWFSASFLHRLLGRRLVIEASSKPVPI
ncbi:hypothetical protein [Pseudomonas tolaasii]|uniref:hypothetical protein n=1 Tax=Pseudomonas tolaasii TaxID=29442 RepID=UPI00273515A3|nr:hypothetical protein [Pseudomonas tolaasii]WLH54023.1 hypothetical protein PSH62_10565 [Pseudomonas tolaasii]